MIRNANTNDIAAVNNIYQELFNYEITHGRTTNWVNGVYPTKNTAKAALKTNTLYVLEIDDKIKGSMILNQIQPDEYQNIHWQNKHIPAEVLVIHTLCIAPAIAKKGYGKKMILYVMKKAQQLGYKTIRLDTWIKNEPAISLYKAMNFTIAGTAPMYLQNLIKEEQIFFEYKI